MRLSDIRPSPENDDLYGPVDPKDPEVVSLYESIKREGLREAIVLTLDNFIISGHRRFVAGSLAGLTEFPCKREPITRQHDKDRFMVLLREFNRQRVKKLDTMFREELIDADPTEAYTALIGHRAQSAIVAAPPMQIVGETRRFKISDAKLPMLQAVQKILNRMRSFWPISERVIHYQLLNNPPRMNAGDPGSAYYNHKRAAKNLSDLVTRARLEGVIPFEAISDETRPIVLWKCHNSARTFIADELGQMLKGYWRNLQQSQPNHIEVFIEKNTLLSIVKPVAMEYCLPITSGRGFCSIPPRRDMRARITASGKSKLVLLILTDFDPEGMAIANSFAKSMRDEFTDLQDVHPIRVAITPEQIRERNLPPNMDAKKDSTNYNKFVEKYGENVWELESIQPEDLQGIFREAIESVIDRPLLNAEIEADKKDAAFLDAVRGTVHEALKGINLN